MVRVGRALVNRHRTAAAARTQCNRIELVAAGTGNRVPADMLRVFIKNENIDDGDGDGSTLTSSSHHTLHAVV